MQTHAHAKVMHTPPALMQLQHAGPLKGPSAPTMMSVPRMPQTEFGQAMMMDGVCCAGPAAKRGTQSGGGSALAVACSQQ